MLKIEHLKKSYENFSLDCSLEVKKGHVTGLIGQNGAGKSTTINLILNELNKDSGQIQVFGIDHTIPTVKENIGVVFDECKFHSVLNAKDIAKILSGSYKTWDMNLFKEYMKRFAILEKIQNPNQEKDWCFFKRNEDETFHYLRYGT